jgi:hypothetical protein
VPTGSLQSEKIRNGSEKFFRFEVFLIVSLLAKPQIFLQNNTLRGENTKQNDMEQNNIAGNFHKIYPG